MIIAFKRSSAAIVLLFEVQTASPKYLTESPRRAVLVHSLLRHSHCPRSHVRVHPPALGPASDPEHATPGPLWRSSASCFLYGPLQSVTLRRVLGSPLLRNRHKQKQPFHIVSGFPGGKFCPSEAAVAYHYHCTYIHTDVKCT